MCGTIISAILLLAFIITVWLCGSSKEEFDEGGKGTYVRLYEGFGQKKLAYQTSGYDKIILPVDLKSVDIYLAQLGDERDAVRKVEIWSMYDGSNSASTEASFYNSYLEPEVELRSNPAKYQLLIRVAPGEHLRADLIRPVKKILLIVRD
jgi:hypothetical protein